MLQAYYNQYNLNSISLIPTNLYGPRDHFNTEYAHVIPSLITKIIDAKTNNKNFVECWGSGNQTRDFLYVSDAEGIIKSIFSDLEKPTVINLGSGVETSIKEIVNIIIKICNIPLEIIWNTDQPEGQPRRLMDINKAKKLLDWTPKTSLINGLTNTINYYANKIK